MRVKFRKGMQRKFMERVLVAISAPSLRSLRQRGFDVPYPTLKSYYQEKRLLPEDFFSDLCYISGIARSSLNFVLVRENWGQVLGGKKSKR